ncbi:MAG: hypothetical protein JNL01_06610 [Bdellovibrionales bacterium]|nr:hypothetical protein [Bdellovibrionales bacterium]
MWLEIGAVAGMVLSMWLLAMEGGARFRDRSQDKKPARRRPQGAHRRKKAS